jgi:hypothetical protein
MGTIFSWVAAFERVYNTERNRTNLILDSHLQTTSVAAMESILGSGFVFDIVPRSHGMDDVTITHTHTEREREKSVATHTDQQIQEREGEAKMA